MIKCRECSQEKSETEYRINGKKANGKTKYRQPCKLCIKLKKTNNIKPQQLDYEIEINRNNTYDCGLTKEDIQKIKKLIAITNHNVMVNTITDSKTTEETVKCYNREEQSLNNNNLMVDYEFDKKNRLKSTYNIEKNIKVLLENYCNKNFQSSSDVVNLALINFLNHNRP